MLNNYEYFQYADQTMYGLVMELRASVAKGEVVSERRTEKHEYRFDVFATWLDHLKYEIQQRRLLKWLPCWLSRRLCVRYQPIVKTRLDSYPVQVTRVCPHVNVSWDKNPKVHIHYLEGY